MFQKKKIILSYDYELFFGDRSGTVLKSLIEPTNLLLDAMDSVGFKGNFFVDWQMLKYLKEANTERTLADHQLIIDQLKDMVYRGHRIELHIHPHWVDAKYNGDGTWDFSEFRHYSLNSFSEQEIVDMFVEGTNLLTNIAREVDSEYKIVAFRAGGWAVQPFDKLKKGFQKAGIKIDSSPCKGFCAKHTNFFYDFRVMSDSSIYHFSNDVCKEDPAGEFLEIPITPLKRPFVVKVIERLYQLLTNNCEYLTDGTHHRSNDNDSCDESYKMDNDLKMLSLYLSPYSIPIVINMYKDRDLLCFIQHPKDQTDMTNKSIKALNSLCASITYKDLLEL